MRVVVDEHKVKNKPKALNTALPHCRGDVVGVFDAEDDVAVDLLRNIDTLFRARHADVVQGGVQLMNFRSSWWSMRNVLEYFFWFASRLHFHARNRFIPLGGNTVFVRRDLLQFVGGWDEECLAEDCELGIRLSALGARTVVAYAAELATQEETPPDLKGLIRQRTRWNQGYLQVLRKGEWKVLPSRSERLLARYLLAMPFAQAFSGVMVPISAADDAAAARPRPVRDADADPARPAHRHRRDRGARAARVRPHVRAEGAAARPRVPRARAPCPIRSCWPSRRCAPSLRESRGQRGWEKTEHVGAHLELAPSRRGRRSRA